MRKVLTALLLSCLLIGCSAINPPTVDPTQVALAYYNQDHTYRPMELSGVKSITLEAVEGQEIRLIMTSQLEPLSIYPRDPSTLAHLMDGLWKIGTVVGSSIVGYEMVQGLSAAPKVQEPFIVKVPQ